MIGVAVSTRNRRPTFERNFVKWRRYLPERSFLVVVDDASSWPLVGGDTIENGSLYRLISHDHRLGVAMTKNAGMAALAEAGCEHLFLADDDVGPASPDWWVPYVESPELHLSYQWPNAGYRKGRAWDDKCHDGLHFQVDFPRGVMLYAHRTVLDAVGGMDPAHGAWGGEHVEWQHRIHDAGLTTWRYADVLSSKSLWAEPRSGSTFPASKRRRVFECTGIQWQKPRPRFVPYRQDHTMQDYSLGPEIVDTGREYYPLRHVLDMQPAGLAVEFGVGAGTSTRIIAEHMPVVGFDSGQGLPEDWRPDYPKGSLAFGVPQIENVSIVEGWFADTLPDFDFSRDYIGLVHMDADLYSSTATALKHVGPYLRPGCYIVFDEWHSYPGAEYHEQKAWREFADKTGIGWTVVGHGNEQWVIRITGRRDA